MLAGNLDYILPRDADQCHRRGCGHGRGTDLVTQQRHLAKEIPLPEITQVKTAISGFLAGLGMSVGDDCTINGSYRVDICTDRLDA